MQCKRNFVSFCPFAYFLINFYYLKRLTVMNIFTFLQTSLCFLMPGNKWPPTALRCQKIHLLWGRTPDLPRWGTFYSAPPYPLAAFFLVILIFVNLSTPFPIVLHSPPPPIPMKYHRAATGPVSIVLKHRMCFIQF